MKDFITVMDAAKRLGVGRDTMYKICKSKGFPAFQLPAEKQTMWRISREGFEQWINDKGAYVNG